jgi:ubiquinone/menaquinone biosynthesis C-methylase UbiE
MASQAPYQSQAVRRLFDRMAPSYDWVQRITSLGFSVRWRRRLLQALPEAPEGAVVLDLMTGRGELWPALVQKYPGATWHALDFSPAMLERAAQRNTKQYRDAFQLTAGDALQTGCGEAVYDVVLCAFGLKTLDASQWQQLAGEVRRILKPGGVFAFVEVSLPPGVVLRRLYRGYLRWAVPLAGRLARGHTADYRLLWTYTAAFGNAGRPAACFAAVGLIVQPFRYFWGCATGFTGVKPP